MDDMGDDAVATLDGYGLARAHLVGTSLGVMIAQLVTLRVPGLVLSLSLIGSSAFDEDDPDLPQMDPALLRHFGTSTGATAPPCRARVRPGVHPRERDEPQPAVRRRGLRRTARGDHVPTVVIHGRHDPILSHAHGEQLAQKLCATRMVTLEAGHELNPRDWPRIVEAIREITA